MCDLVEIKKCNICYKKLVICECKRTNLVKNESTGDRFLKNQKEENIIKKKKKKVSDLEKELEELQNDIDMMEKNM